MTTRIEYRDPERDTSTAWKIAAAALLGAAAAVGLGIYLARDQMRRHRRELFSPHPLRRLAALGYLKSHPSVDDLPLLRDYLTWEERPLLRKRASTILSRLEGALAGDGFVGSGEPS
ncbi:hypothetical protein [Candidatus Palauibacter sp.]|uniref:hypothetical protein n=1 Tax=Candidatus Palauibacter sp. TaxID=3101350 RepID=UPI003C70323E